jgi:anthranilate phosphoribosyltransferase
VLKAGGARRALVVYGHDGLDELTTTTTSTVLDFDAHADGGVTSYEVEPGALGLRPASLDQLRGADAATNADLVRRVLGGETGPRRDIVLLNAAAGLVAAGLAADLPEGVGRAAEVIDGGRAAEALDRLVTVSAAATGAG